MRNKPLMSQLQSAIDKRSNDIEMYEHILCDPAEYFETDEGESFAYMHLRELRKTQTLEKRIYGELLRSCRISRFWMSSNAG